MDQRPDPRIDQRPNVTQQTTSSGATWGIAVLLVVVIAAGAFFVFGGGFGPRRPQLGDQHDGAIQARDAACRSGNAACDRHGSGRSGNTAGHRYGSDHAAGYGHCSGRPGTGSGYAAADHALIQ